MKMNFTKQLNRVMMTKVAIIMAFMLSFSITSCDDKNAEDTDVDAGPTILSFSPEMAKAGESVTITGYRLKDATAVSFNGAAGIITNSTSTTLTVTVPASVTKGKITVTTPAGSHTSTNEFEQLPDED